MIRVHCEREARQLGQRKKGVELIPVEPDVPRRIVLASRCGQRPRLALDSPEVQRQIRSALDGEVPRVLAADRPGHVREFPDAELLLKMRTSAYRCSSGGETEDVQRRENTDETTQQTHRGRGGKGGDVENMLDRLRRALLYMTASRACGDVHDHQVPGVNETIDGRKVKTIRDGVLGGARTPQGRRSGRNDNCLDGYVTGATRFDHQGRARPPVREPRPCAFADDPGDGDPTGPRDEDDRNHTRLLVLPHIQKYVACVLNLRLIAYR